VTPTVSLPRVVCLTGRPGGVDRTSVERIAASVPEVEVVPHPADDDLPEGLEALGLVATGQCPLLARLPPGIGWVHIIGTGVEGLPEEAFDGRTVTCSRGASAVPIAEFVLAAMLAFEKQLPEVWVDDSAAPWYRAQLGGLRGRTLAVVGLGGIGAEVARLGSAFGMSVRGLRRRPAADPVPGVHLVTDLHELVGGARHVVVAAPATPATRGLVGPSVLAAMGPGAHLVNVARGSLVDQDALRVALEDGRVARATLDTTEPEPPPEGHWLYSHPGVRLSPHVSWSSPEGTDRIVQLCVENIQVRVAGRPLAGVVDPVERY
jgi:phosphoglycerate dehydrogenase-like enzyme